MQLLIGLLLIVWVTASSAAVKVVFLNGIKGKPEASLASIERIKNVLIKDGYMSQFESTGAQFETWLNPANGVVDDVSEVYVLANNSGAALTNARLNNASSQTANSPEYRDSLGRLYTTKISSGSAESEDARKVYAVVRDFGAKLYKDIVSDGFKVIVVSHSQGNQFSEAVNAYIRYGRTADQIAVLDNNLRIVGSAVPAASTPNGRYLSVSEDNVLDNAAKLTAGILNFSLLPRNVVLCGFFDSPCNKKLSDINPNVHDFVKIYASDFVDKNTGRSMASLLAKQITDSLVEVTTRPSDEFSGGSLDMTKWRVNNFSFSEPSITNGVLKVGTCQSINSRAPIKGNRFVLEIRYAVSNTDYLVSGFSFLDYPHRESFSFGDSSGWGGFYFWTNGTGQVFLGRSSTSYTVVRITVNQGVFTVERGDSLENMIVLGTYTSPVNYSDAARIVSFGPEVGCADLTPTTPTPHFILVDWIRLRELQ